MGLVGTGLDPVAVERAGRRRPALADDPDLDAPGGRRPPQVDLAAPGLDPDLADLAQQEDRPDRHGPGRLDPAPAAQDGVGDRRAGRDPGVLERRARRTRRPGRRRPGCLSAASGLRRTT